MNEEEQIDELSKKTLGSYAKRSSNQRMAAGIVRGAQGDSLSDQGKKDFKRITTNRKTGHDRAVDRLSEEKLLESIAEAYIEENDLDELDDQDYDNIVEIYRELEESSRKSHGNVDIGSPRGQGLSPSAKRELDRQTRMPGDVNEPEVEKKTWDAFRATNVKSAATRQGDNLKGDKKIVNPVDDISKKTPKKEDDGFKDGHIDVSVKKGNT